MVETLTLHFTIFSIIPSTVAKDRSLSVNNIETVLGKNNFDTEVLIHRRSFLNKTSNNILEAYYRFLTRNQKI